MIAMEKLYDGEREWEFDPGVRHVIPLSSVDRRESFLLDVTRYRIKLSKASYQNRTRQVIILMRLDIDGPPHRNPDGAEIACPHLHIYRTGYGDKWAIPAPTEHYTDPTNLLTSLVQFMRHCNIVSPPTFQPGLF